MADIIAKAGWDNEQLRKGAAQAVDIAQKAKAQAEKVMAGFGAGVGFAGGLMGVTGAASLASKVIENLKRGLDFNAELNTAEVGIANVLAQFQGLDAVAAQAAAQKAMMQIAELEPKTAGTMSTLVEGFMATLAAGQQVGLSVEENIDLVGKFANALANAGLPAEQIAQEMRSIITGNIGADSSLAKIFNITNADVAAARAAGDMYGWLTNKLGKMGEAGDSAAVRFSTLQSAIDKSLGTLTAKMFDQMSDGAVKLSNALSDPAITSRIAALGDDLGKVAAELMGLVDMALQSAPEIGKVLIQIASIGPALARTIGGAASMFGSGMEILKNVGEVIGETAGYALVLKDELDRGASFADAQATAAAVMEEHYKAAAAAAAELASGSQPPANTTGDAPAPGAANTGGAAGMMTSARAASELAQIERLRLQYAEAQFTAIQRRSTLEQQLANLTTMQARKAEEMRRAMDAGPLTEQAMLQFSLEDLKIDEQRLQLIKQIKDAKDASTDATTKELTAKAEALQSLQAETAILQARANGDAARVALLEREQRIQDRVLQIKKELGIEGQKALDMAKGIVDLEDKANKADEKGKREKGSRIQGFSAERMGGRVEARQRADERMATSRARIAAASDRSFAGLKEFDRINARNPDGSRVIPLGKAFANQSQRNAPSTDPSVPILDEIKILMAANNDYLASITAE